MPNKEFGNLHHPNSLWAKASVALKAKARANRIEYLKQRRAIEDWANSGFLSTSHEEDES